MRTTLLLPDGSCRDLMLDDNCVLLVGREPSESTVSSLGVDAESVRVERAEVAGVSANHVAVWTTGATAHVADLGSRNGTWVNLPAHAVVRLPATEGVTVTVGMAAHARNDQGAPRDAQWSGSEDFPAAVARAVKTWLSELGEEASVIVGRDLVDDSGLGGPIPIPGGLQLYVRPARTVGANWLARMSTVWRYVDVQSRIFEAEESSRNEGLVLASEAIRASHRDVIEAARRGHRVLLLGPSGAGKEGLARAYHRHSGRTGPFVALNCGELNRELLRAELFGAEAGAFTGSVKRIVGAVERANGGTLFLDEIGEMPLDVQPMLLRFLDHGEYTRLGNYGQVLRSDVRIVCATNRDLREETQQGRFRQDLWFRLSIKVIDVPGLSERLADVVAYLRGRQLESGCTVLDALTGEALAILEQHRWDGNFRELANFVERLPRDARPQSIDERVCQRALESGAIRTIVTTKAAPLAAADDQWNQWCDAALAAFRVDHAELFPRTWDEVQELLEKYLKPLLMVRLGLGTEVVPREADALPKLARRLADAVQADRGTALKQLTRYVERFVG